MTHLPEPCGDGCADALAHLWEYLDSELDQVSAHRVALHLDACGGCLAEYRVEVVIKQVVRRGCSETAPEALRQRIEELCRRRDLSP
jgi:mycothiol system anti-sigma-R factor